MDNLPLVSVVLPCFNAEKYIKDAVESILNQSYKNIEFIVVNDCSTDDSVAILSTFEDERMHVIHNEENAGYPTSMNNGIAIAKGKYIARMDADDTSTLDRIEKQVQLHELHPEFAFVSSKRAFLTPNGIKYSTIKPIKDNSYVQESWDMLFDGTRKFTDPASLILKTRIDEVGGYNSYERTGMDVDLWFRILEVTNKKVGVLNEYLYYRRVVPNAITFSLDTKHDSVREKASLRHHKKKYDIKKSKKTIKSHIRSLNSMIINCILVNDYKGAMSFFKKVSSYKGLFLTLTLPNIIKKYINYNIRKTRTYYLLDNENN